MQSKKSWSSVLYLYANEQLRPIKNSRDASFHVGIWWHDDERLVAFLQSIAEIKSTGHLINSDLTHESAWKTARCKLFCQEETEYFEVPRGRILWDTVHQCGILYHGNSTPPDLIDELASFYRLPRWEVRLDEDYLTGDALIEFYSLD